VAEHDDSLSTRPSRGNVRRISLTQNSVKAVAPTRSVVGRILRNILSTRPNGLVDRICIIGSQIQRRITALLQVQPTCKALCKHQNTKNTHLVLHRHS
jgi:hypothetical protein